MAEPALANGGPTPVSLLLVDDKPANLTALEAVLEPLGQRLVRALSGEEALRHLLHFDFAAILMDVQMPGLDGIQTAALIKKRERTRRIPIIFLTAIHRDPSYVFKGYANGAVDYLLKPFDPEILRSKVSVFIDLYQKEQEIRRQAARLREVERRSIERKGELRYLQLIEAMPLAVWCLSSEGKIYFANRRWTEYSGLTADQTDGDAGWECVHPDDREHVRAARDEALRTGRPLESEHRLRRVDGAYRWHLQLMVPEKDERGRVAGWISTATDIDDQKRAREEAETASRTKDEFLAMVSHELRTPLNAILGWADMLRMGRLPEERVAHALGVILRNGRTQAQLIEDLLDVSRIVAGKLRIDREAVDLGSIVQAAVDTVRPMVTDRRIELTVLVGEGPFEIEGDANRLQQVVWNLLSNAVKFSGPDSRVEVSLERADDRYRVRVRDSGIGIEPDFLPHVFDRFRQADSGGTRQHGGLGLGLAIARHIVELHDGRIEAHSDGRGQGATMTVTLPARVVVPAEAPVLPAIDAPSGSITAPRATIPESEAPRLDGVSVLVVDDEVDARDLIAEFLRQAGARVTAVGGVTDALERIGEARYDVLVSDLSMPTEDGYSLMRKLSDRGAGLPAIALSAHASTEDRGRALEAGFQTHLAKPFEERLLLDLIARLAQRE